MSPAPRQSVRPSSSTSTQTVLSRRVPRDHSCTPRAISTPLPLRGMRCRLPSGTFSSQFPRDLMNSRDIYFVPQRLEQLGSHRTYMNRFALPQIQSHRTGSGLDMATRVFLCPHTGQRVQGWFADAWPATSCTWSIGGRARYWAPTKSECRGRRFLLCEPEMS